MKTCPVCQRSYPDDAGFLPRGRPAAVARESMVPVAPQSDDPRVGQKLCDRYEIRRVVADGGMGRVYEGIDKQSNTRIAVKVLHDDVSKDDVAVERFPARVRAPCRSRSCIDFIVDVHDFQFGPAPQGLDARSWSFSTAKSSAS